ncbi:MAG: hypothetical protein IPI10_11970 [Bacteroidetes bacterium]|nr:hypothetical protein [Bacteroidota bacterium]
MRQAEALKEKNRNDSLAAVALAQQKAEAGAKQKAEADAKAAAALAEKNRLDSISAANKAAQEKESADRQAKAYAEIEAKKKLLAKTANKTDEKPATASSAPVPKIIESDYKEGVTDETIKENNRTIYRTVVKKDGSALNYQKVVYNWGGVFYFKNDNSMTELTFQQELKNYRAELK